jgi:FK506-binding nuclear protein
MAAIDPTEEVDEDVETSGVKPVRSTLKIVRVVGSEDLSDSDEEDDEEYMMEEDEDEESSDDEEVNGGPSDPEKVKKALEAAAMKSSSSDEESDDDDAPIDIKDALKRIAKGKAPATDDDDDSEDEEIEMDEFVVCTLDTEKVISRGEALLFTFNILTIMKALSTTS